LYLIVKLDYNLINIFYFFRPNYVLDEDVVWPCNPEKVLVAHRPATNDIISFGSGYGGNSLLGKKCFALRIGSALAKKEVLYLLVKF